MKRFRLFLTMLCLMAGMATTTHAQTVEQMGIAYYPTDSICKLGLYYSYYTFNGHKFGESYYATLYDIKSSATSVTVPATVTHGGHVYTVIGISDEETGIDLTNHNVHSLTFEGDVTMWGKPIKVPSGMYGFTSLWFKGRSFPFDGDVSNYFTCTSLNNLSVHLVDKNEEQITQLRKTAPWNQFTSVTYHPIHLSMTTDITLCPETNFNEDVALYNLGTYSSFAEADYDRSKLALLNYKTPGVYEIDKYQNYVLVAHYDKKNVDFHYLRDNYEWTMGTHDYIDYDEFLDVTSDKNLELTFTWKTTSMNFIQVNGCENVAYTIAGNNPMSGSNDSPIWTLSGAKNGDWLTLNLPADSRTLEKVVVKHGDEEQTIEAPESANGNYKVQFYVPTEKYSYVYIYWVEPKNIQFADAAVKAICVENWDTNEDGELSYEEAAAVADIGETFRGNTDITSFDELQYFTGLNTIPQNAFREDTALTSVVIPQSVLRVEAWSFQDCVALKNAVLPDSLIHINSGAFMNTAIQHITLPEKGPLMLGISLFQNSSLKTLYIPANLTGTINRELVAKCKNLISISVDEGNRNYDSREGCNAIIKTSTNTLIAGCKNSVIPEGVKALGDHAFYYTDIKKVELPASLDSIGGTSFFHCDSLATVVAHMPEPFAISMANIQGLHPNCKLYVPNGKKGAYEAAGWTTTIFKGGIFELSTIENIDFADVAVKTICVTNWDTNGDGELSYGEAAAVTSLGNYFKGNTTITSFDELQYFTKLTQLTSEQFSGATNLKSIVLPQSVSSFQTDVFRSCQNLEHIVLPDSLVMINTNSFFESGIKSITLPQKGNLQLAYNAFSGTRLKSLYIPANVTRIYNYMLSDCNDLISIAVDEGNRNYDSREGCNAIIETATNTLIASCKNTVVPSSVTAIGDYAFYHNRQLKTLELPSGIETIGDYIISTCDSLTKVIAHMPDPPTVTTTNFGNVISNCKLYVPKGKKDVYEAAGWTTTLFKGGIFEDNSNDGDVNGDGQVTIADVTKLVNIILGKE